MKKFALITEGVSEHRVIKYIINRFFKDDALINQIQPKMFGGKQAKDSPGGWNEVLKYCERDEIEDILIENDFLVIQIDTDQSQTKPFNISHTNAENKIKPVPELYEEVLENLKNRIQSKILEDYKDRIIFAISIHTIECWFLPLYYSTESKKSAISKCLDKLNTELRKKNIKAISNKDKNTPKSIRTYETILKNWNKITTLKSCAKHNTGFQKFVDSLVLIKKAQS